MRAVRLNQPQMTKQTIDQNMLKVALILSRLGIKSNPFSLQERSRRRSKGDLMSTTINLVNNIYDENIRQLFFRNKN